MDHAIVLSPLLWAESIGAAILLLAGATAVSCRWLPKSIRVVAPVALALLLVLPPAIVGAEAFYFQTAPGGDFGIPALAWAVVTALGACVVLIYGLQSDADSERDRAASWSGRRLALSSGAICAIMAATFLLERQQWLTPSKHDSAGRATAQSTPFDALLEVECALFGLLLLAWTAAVAFRWKHRPSEGYVPVVVVCVLSAVLISLQMALAQMANNDRPGVWQPHISTIASVSSLGYAILWIESLAAAALVVACVVTFAAHGRAWPGQRSVPMLFAFVVAALASLVCQWSIRLKDLCQVDHPWVSWLVLWTTAFCFAAGSILIYGLRRSTLNDGLVARGWSRLRLSLGAAALLIILGVTLTNLDAAISMQLAANQTEANARLAQMLLPSIPDRDNAALVYRQAAEAEPKPEPSSDEFLQSSLFEEMPVTWRFPISRSFDALDPKLETYLKNRGAYLGFLRAASRKDECRFDRDFFNGLGTLLPELNLITLGSLDLVLDGLSRVARGDLPGAEADLAAVLRMPNHVNDPVWICVFIGTAVERKGATLMERLLAERAKTKTSIQDPALRLLLESAGEDSHFRWYLQRACKGDEALCIANYTTLPTFYAEMQGYPENKAWTALPIRLGLSAPWLLNSLAYRLGFLLDDLASYRRQMGTLHNSLGQS